MSIKEAYGLIDSLKTSIARRIPEKITDDNFIERLMDKSAVAALETALGIIREQCPGVLEEVKENE